MQACHKFFQLKLWLVACRKVLLIWVKWRAGSNLLFVRVSHGLYNVTGCRA